MKQTSLITKGIVQSLVLHLTLLLLSVSLCGVLTVNNILKENWMGTLAFVISLLCCFLSVRFFVKSANLRKWYLPLCHIVMISLLYAGLHSWLGRGEVMRMLPAFPAILLGTIFGLLRGGRKRSVKY